MLKLLETVREAPWTVLLVAVAYGFVIFLRRLYVARQFVYRLQKDGAPMPDFRVVTGHLHVLREYTKKLPPNCTMHTVFAHIAANFPGGMCYIDLWPFSRPILVITATDPAVLMQEANLDKPPELNRGLMTVNGGDSLVSMHGATWKTWRGIFNPGFSTGYMLEMVPAMTREVIVFRDILRRHAREGDVFQLADAALRLTMDVIGSLALETRFHHQKKDHPLATALRTQVDWTNFGTVLNPFKRYLSPRPLVLWYNNRRMKGYIYEAIDKRFSEIKQQEASGSSSKKSKSVISLVLQTYVRETPSTSSGQLDKNFRDITAAQLRNFLFAGHDTSGSTLVYCFHVLASHPEALARMRAEHDDVFGTDLSQLESTLSQDPALLNRLSYTQAVIKETLRLHPPSSVMRLGRHDVVFTDDDGRRCPSEGTSVWALNTGLHYNPRHWKDPAKFIPERWLVEPEDPLYPTKGSWRPFGHGQRNCIGQSLALMEIRVVLVMTVREFVIKPAYEEWDKRFPPGERVTRVHGDRAYEAENGGGGAQPADGYPCTVFLRK